MLNVLRNFDVSERTTWRLSLSDSLSGTCKVTVSVPMTMWITRGRDRWRRDMSEPGWTPRRDLRGGTAKAFRPRARHRRYRRLQPSQGVEQLLAQDFQGLEVVNRRALRRLGRELEVLHGFGEDAELVVGEANRAHVRRRRG